MKTIIISIITTGSLFTVTAQTPVDTSRLVREKTPSAWSQRPDTTKGKQQEPISNQPFSNPPTPAPMTNPIDNPTSGQTRQPEYNQPIDVPPPAPRPDTFNKRKPAIPVTPAAKPSTYDTLPGTKRNG